MRTIFKYAVEVGPVNEIEMPLTAEIIHVECQGPPQVVHFWALLDDGAPRVRRSFVVQPTGGPLSQHMIWRGTTMPRPDIVWHLFEVR